MGIWLKDSRQSEWNNMRKISLYEIIHNTIESAKDTRKSALRNVLKDSKCYDSRGSFAYYKNC